MPRRTPVSVAMTRHVRTLDLDSKPSEIRRTLIANEFHHMPIVDGNRLVGIVSWRDLVRAYRSAQAADEEDLRTTDQVLDQNVTVAELMTRELITLRADDPLDRAIDLIADASVHSVLILDDDKTLVGIVTDKNIVEYLSS